MNLPRVSELNTFQLCSGGSLQCCQLRLSYAPVHTWPCKRYSFSPFLPTWAVCNNWISFHFPLPPEDDICLAACDHGQNYSCPAHQCFSGSNLLAYLKKINVFYQNKVEMFCWKCFPVGQMTLECPNG